MVASDELKMFKSSQDEIPVGEQERREGFLRKVERFRFPLPESYAFDRDEANERDAPAKLAATGNPGHDIGP